MQNIYLNQKDKEIFDLIETEFQRQNNSLELIASENVASRAVIEAQGSILTNKYAEGYPGKRYYGGCVNVDKIENLAIERAKKLFNCKYANVQPHSGSQANQAVFLALAKPGDTILGMGLDSGGHLTHGASPNLSGKWFNAVKYGVNRDDNLINYDEVEDLALTHKPKIIIAGGSAYPRKINFARFREIADKVGAYLLCDIAHYSGLIVAEHYPSPMEYAHIVTSTTHKTLRGPRGGIILTNDDIIAKKIDSAIFPGLQGGPLMHVIAAKAVCFEEALSEEFKEYTSNVIKNAKVLAKTLKNQGFKLVTDGTDSHLILMDLRDKNITGKSAEEFLEKHHIICNKNAVAFDTKSPFITSGIRLGTPACTSRGFKEKEFETVGNIIAEILNKMNEKADFLLDEQIIDKVKYLCENFPINYD